MLSLQLKHFIQKTMLSSSPDSPVAEMNNAQPEDLEFTGFPADASAPEERAGKIVSAMTLDEKIDFVSGYKSLGIRALPRLGLPSVWMSDASSGARSYGATTSFPAAVAMAASWDTGLISRAAAHIAESARAKGVSILLGPGVNIARVPTCGRNFEYMGEDPFLAGRLASAYIAACNAKGIICTLKHLAVNNSDYDRHKVSSNLDERTLREIYLPAFEMAVREGRAPAIMSSYNPINGTWASEHHELLTEILREEWGFEGFVVSDWNSLYSTSGPLKAGLDIEMPAAKWLERGKVKAALSSGDAEEADLDRMVGNICRTLISAGVYDRPVRDPEAREFCTAHDEAALDTARGALILLKNEKGALPLPEGKGRLIAVCGPNTVDSATMGGGSCNIARTTGTVDLLEGLKAIAAPGTRIVHVPWTKRALPDAEDRRMLAEADAVVAACGFSYLLESELYDRPWRLPRAQRRLIATISKINPRTVVVLTAGGGVETDSWISTVPALVHGLYLGQSVGTATAEALFGRISPSGKLPFSMARRWKDIAAVKNYPNRYSTTSLGRMFLGQGNPRFRRMRHWHYREGLMVGYRHFDSARVEPAFPFGHGLSYAAFEVDKVKLSAEVIGPKDSVDVMAEVRNTGLISGAEVVQVYIADSESRLPRPEKELKGFAKVHLKPGEAKAVRITLNPGAFRYWDPEAESSSNRRGSWITEKGEFRVLVGRSSRDILVELPLEMDC